jgi:hypothetical protein
MTELVNFLKSNNIQIHRLWLDVEPDSVCEAWSLGASNNLALAKQWTALLRSTGLKWGIYGNGYVKLHLVSPLPSSISFSHLAVANGAPTPNSNQWTAMFPERSSDIGSDLSLWAVKDDGVAGVSTVPASSLMGGWTTSKVVAKQYNLGVNVCGGNVDYDSFLD